MKITMEWLNSKGACSGGKAWLAEHHPDGCELQPLLDELAATREHDDWCVWLMNAVGKIDAEVVIEGDLEVAHSIFMAGRLKVSGRITAKSSIKAGWGIEAGLGIEAGDGIEAGCGIKAGEGIEAGEDFGIYIGLKLRLSASVKCISKTKPKNLMCGEWEDAK